MLLTGGYGWKKSPLHAELDFAGDVVPLGCAAEEGEEFVEEGFVFGGELEPGEEVEGAAEVAGVVELAGDCGEVLERAGDVLGLGFEDGAAFVLSEVPPFGGLGHGNEDGAGGLGAAEVGVAGEEGDFLVGVDVAAVAVDASELPAGGAERGECLWGGKDVDGADVELGDGR